MRGIVAMNKNTNWSDFASWKFLLPAITLCTVIHWAILALGIPAFDNLPYWKYNLRLSPLLPVWVFAAFASLGLARIAYSSRLKPGMKLLLFILLGTAIQYSFAFAKGQGLDGIRDRMVSSGHAEFAKAAVEQPGDMLWVAQNYEAVAAKKKYGYIGSKPPGTFLFYMAFEQGSRALFPARDHVQRLENLRTFASLTWPLISYLVLIPLYFLAREIFKDSTAALLACNFYLAVPSVTLITLHTDQTLYPLLAVLPVLTAFVAYRKNNFRLAMLSGALFYFAVYFSFGLAAVGLFFLAPLFTPTEDNPLPAFQRFAKYGGGILLGGALLHIPVSVFLKYAVALRYANAWANHLAWKGWEENLETYLKAGATNLIEFALWIGLPLTLLFLAGLYDAIRQKNRAARLELLLAGIFAFLLAFGKTKAEVARLWLFLVPFICAGVSHFIQRQAWPGRNKAIFTTAILFLEFGTTYFTIHYQDFS